ncbi:unnamed protein product, partial [Symbiodinium sp. KB8]
MAQEMKAAEVPTVQVAPPWTHTSQLGLQDLGFRYAGLNIEGPGPYLNMPQGCTWYNIVQVIDDPTKGHTFDAVMAKVRAEKLDFIETAVGIDIQAYIADLVAKIMELKAKHNNILLHVHQYAGTTKLAEVLEIKTGLHCITDKTNFAEHPVDYAQDYPHIDALVSISQCAGFGLAPGTVFYPDRFDVLDADLHVIHRTETIVTNGWATEPCRMLVTDRLWNPHRDESFLVLDAAGSQILEFVVKHTAAFDASHNHEHAVAVTRNAVALLDHPHVVYLALLHDVCDHKYPDSLPRKDLTTFMHKILDASTASKLDAYIDQVSFSKQRTTPDPHAVVDPVLTAVRDGDRMEAIGEIGIERCETFIKAKGGKLPQDFVAHAQDKLLRL